MSRLPAVRREDLGAEDAETWDAIAETHRGAVAGPFSALIHVPPLAGRVSDLEGYFRFSGLLDPPERELIVCTVTRELGAAFPYAIHLGIAREVGTREEALAVVEARAGLDGLEPREALLIEVARSLCRQHTLPALLYARAAVELGDKQLVEAVTLAGHYSMISLVVNAFDVRPPEGR